jgi:hypothetical protein
MIFKTLFFVAFCVSTALAQSTSATTERVFTLSQTDTPDTIKQIADAMRLIADIQKISSDYSLRTIMVQTSAAQADLAEWISNLLDSAAPTPEPAEYAIPGSSDDVVAVFFASHANGPRQLQEMINASRQIAEIARIVPFLPTKALVIRGRVWQDDLSGWLFNQLNSPPAGQPSASYSVAAGVAPPGWGPEGLDDPNSVRVYYFSPTTTAQSLYEMVNQLRTRLQLTRVSPCPGWRAIALRGSESQVAESDRMLNR